MALPKLTNIFFPPSEFETLTYNISLIPRDQKVLDFFPDLHSIDEFYAELPVDRDIAMRFIILQYDPKSFLKNKIPDWKKRKMTAALIAGWKEFDEKTGLWNDDVDSIMKCQVQNFNIMVIRFCRIFNNHLYSLLVTSQDIFYYGMEQVMNFEIQKVKGKSDFDHEKARNLLLAQYEGTQGKINKYALELLNDEQDISFKNLKRDLFCMVDKEALGLRKITPERQSELAENDTLESE